MSGSVRADQLAAHAAKGRRRPSEDSKPPALRLSRSGTRMSTRAIDLVIRRLAAEAGLELDLRFAAGDLAKAAFELADSRWPAPAASTAVYVAAKLLAGGGRIADTVGYESWPERER